MNRDCVVRFVVTPQIACNPCWLSRLQRFGGLWKREKERRVQQTDSSI